MIIFSKKNKSANRGFTLFEAVVTLGIFVLLTGVVLLRYNQFQGSVLVTNLAYDIGLSVREAQVRAISVQSLAGAQDFDIGYGVRFDVTAGNNKEFIIYADNDSSRHYEAGGLDTIVSTYKLTGSYIISNFCTLDALGSTCTNPTSDPRIIDVSFLRPNPNASISLYKSDLTSVPASSPPFTAALIEVSPSDSPDSARSIRVESSGQISLCKKKATECII